MAAVTTEVSTIGAGRSWEAVSLDLETTGLSTTRDRIVEIALVRQRANGERERFVRLVNPMIPIPAAAQAIHQISDEMVRGCPTFRQIAPDVARFLSECPEATLCGHNLLRFDLPLLQSEFVRAGLKPPNLSSRAVVDSLVIFRKLEPHTLGKAVEFYLDGKTHENAHRAQGDAEAALDVWLAQKRRYHDVLGQDLNQIAAFCATNGSMTPQPTTPSNPRTRNNFTTATPPGPLAPAAGRPSAATASRIPLTTEATLHRTPAADRVPDAVPHPSSTEMHIDHTERRNRAPITAASDSDGARSSVVKAETRPLSSPSHPNRGVAASLLATDLCDRHADECCPASQLGKAFEVEETQLKDGRLTFGKHKGKLLTEVVSQDAAYMRWLARTASASRPGFRAAINAAAASVAKIQ
jgi:DNA polymerase-3 subunit epsilon